MHVSCICTPTAGVAHTLLISETAYCWTVRCTHRSHKECMITGCFAAGTGFLLNFTIREHPPGTKHNSSRALSGVNLPLAPDQHRLTDDGSETSKPSQNGSVNKQGKAVLKGHDRNPVATSVASTDDIQGEPHISQLGAAEGPQTSEQGLQRPLGPTAQLKVDMYATFFASSALS